ncbi:MAG: glycosyltransferase family 39 protein [Candidatus Melainabacteria bacterium]|nr:glycosyltransferase family 39 protein [Candidatus Melainabacteria bacterium]
MTVPDLEYVDRNSDRRFWSNWLSNRPQKRAVLSLCILLAIVALGLLFRLNELGKYGLFGDEIYSILVATGKGDPELIAFDSIRPVYFFLLRQWMNFGDSEEWLRLLSVIFGTANIFLTYYLSTLVSGRKVALVAAALMAVSPMEVHYCQLVRMYTLGSFFALLGSIVFIKAWQTGKKQLMFVWAAVRTLMVWTLPLTAVLLGCDIALSLWKERKSKLMSTVIACFVAVIALYLSFAWKMPVLTAHSAYDEWRYGLPVPQIADALMMFVNFTSTALPIQECEGPCEGGMLADLYSSVVLCLITTSFLPAARERWLIWCSAWAILPILLALVASQFTASFVITRYLMFASPFAFIIIAAGWVELWKPWKLRILSILIAVLYVAIMWMNLAHLFTHPVSEDWRETSRFIQAHEKPGDKVIIWNYHSHYLFNYYYRGKNRAYDVIVGHVLDKEKTRLADVKLDVPGLQKISGRTWFVIREAPQNWLLAWMIYKTFKQHLKNNYKVLEYNKLGRTDLYLVTDK